jgi:hypothetical protein
MKKALYTVQVKETIQASHQQWNIKKITIFFRSGKSWFGLVNHLGSPDRMSCKKNYNFVFTDVTLPVKTVVENATVDLRHRQHVYKAI